MKQNLNLETSTLQKQRPENNDTPKIEANLRNIFGRLSQVFCYERIPYLASLENFLNSCPILT
jgi:hypothetical protein